MMPVTCHSSLATFHMLDLAPHHKRGLSLAHPVMNASGLLGFASEYRGLVDFTRLGAFVTNALTGRPRTPAHPPNATPLANGVLIHTGLPNPGVRAAIREYDREWQRLGPPVIVHLAATTPEDVQRSVEHLDRAEGVSGVELGLRDDVSVEEMEHVIRAALGGPPLVVRLPLLRAADLCEAAARAGADALTVGAPLRASASPPGLFSGSRTLQPGEGESQDDGDREKSKGRFYGPESLPIALEAVRTVVGVMQASPLPVVGAGGIFSVEDARAMLAAGAVAVQVDAAVWIEPRLLTQLAQHLGN
jgi:dihydroorotate dehydrogenase (NAD+) catalytic subunit